MSLAPSHVHHVHTPSIILAATTKEQRTYNEHGNMKSASMRKSSWNIKLMRAEWDAMATSGRGAIPRWLPQPHRRRRRRGHAPGRGLGGCRFGDPFRK